jgi:tetratricopeptide (TPR) repeat protein
MAYQSEIEKLEQRYRENPDQWFAALADSYRKAGSLDLALDVVRAGLAKRPNYVSGHIVLGRCLLQQPDDAAATQAFEQVLSLDRENVIALKALSEIAERGGRLDDAQRWLTRLLEVDPMNEEAEQALAQLQRAEPAGAAAQPPAAVEATPAPGATPAEPTEVPQAAAVNEVTDEAAAESTTQGQPDSYEGFVLERSEEALSPEGALEPAHLDDAPEAPSSAEALTDAEALASPPGQEPVEEAAAADATMAPPAGLEPSGFTADAAEPVAPAEGIESMAFEPPAPGEVVQAPELEPMEFTPPPHEAAAQEPAGAGTDAKPFDDQLGWGTGERVSGQVSGADLDAAEHAHESTLEPVLQAPSGPEATQPAQGEPEERSEGDLPLIFPEEAAPSSGGGMRDGEPPPGAEAEPVVTETMAELYVKQGLMAEAREIYRKLVARRPKDPALAARLAALESGATEAAAAAAAGVKRSRLTAAETGGASVRDFLSQVFGGPGMPVPPPGATPPKPPPEPTPMETAFAEPPGEPTRRASDEVSLAAVFGEEPTPSPIPATKKEDKGTGSSFSFDEFFGGQGGKPQQAQGSRPAKSQPDDDDEFKRWLKGLKS